MHGLEHLLLDGHHPGHHLVEGAHVLLRHPALVAHLVHKAAHQLGHPGTHGLPGLLLPKATLAVARTVRLRHASKYEREGREATTVITTAAAESPQGFYLLSSI